MRQVALRLAPKPLAIPPPSAKTLRIRFDRTPPQNEPFQACLYDGEQCYLYTFITHGNVVELNTEIKNVHDILLAPLTGEWKMHHIDLETDGQDVVRFRPTADCHFEPISPVRQEVVIANNREWARRKTETLKYLIGIIAVGTISFQELQGSESAIAFSTGGIIGVFYQLLLQYEIDRIGTHQFIVNASTRLALIALAAAFLVGDAEPSQLGIASGGFLMHKIAAWLAFTL